MSAPPPSLAELRTCFRLAKQEPELCALCEALRGDPRAGAQALATQCVRRLHKLEMEAARIQVFFEIRAALFDAGSRLVAGVDEVGVGPLVGPVVAAAVILNVEKEQKKEFIEKIVEKDKEIKEGDSILIVKESKEYLIL